MNFDRSISNRSTISSTTKINSRNTIRQSFRDQFLTTNLHDLHIALLLFFPQQQFKRRGTLSWLPPTRNRWDPYLKKKKEKKEKKLSLSLSKKADTSAYKILLPTIFPSIHTGVPLLTVYTTFSLLSFDIYNTFYTQSNLFFLASRTLPPLIQNLIFRIVHVSFLLSTKFRHFFFFFAKKVAQDIS